MYQHAMSEEESNNEGVGASASEAESEDINEGVGASASEAESEDGVDPRDIRVVMSQVGHSRRDVIDALRRNNNDMVNAVMDLVINIP